jgi:hypothetical protein
MTSVILAEMLTICSIKILFFGSERQLSLLTPLARTRSN